jgi:hypothetical protein
MKTTRVAAGLSLFALILILGGCVQKPPDAKTDLTNGSSAPGTQGAESKPGESAKSDPPALAVPEDLKHEAYEYFGLGNPDPVVMSVVGGPNGALTNTQTLTLESVKGGEAVYLVRSDLLPDAMEYTVRKDGVYGRQIVEGLNAVPQLQLPADPKPGKTWTTSERGVVQGKKLTVTTTNKIVGLRAVKTKRGNLSALLVVADGSMVLGTDKSTVSSKMWLVKGIGAVRNEFTKRTAGSKKPVQLISEIQ